jgi:septal ring factor EnvC (AmiA/AmiB activator)
MSAVLAFVAGHWRAVVLMVLLSVLGAVIAVQHEQILSVRSTLASERADRAQEKQRAAEAARAAEARYRAEEQRRAAAQQEAIDAAEKQAERARADAAVADAAAGRLRDRVASLVAAARRAATNPEAAASSPPATDAAGMLGFVLDRCISRVRLLAELADRRGIAGAACVRAYDALTPPQPATDAEPEGAP